ncbi:MAG: type II toxin-antitoxin system HicB family antitoxin [Spirochaetales bacterium]|nr:type II toxin-antitoxin system HicB family antitoxin [Spirochaetales bacterium]
MRYVYPAVFEHAKEGGFVVSVPDVEGCFSEGESLVEAMFMIQDALAMMLVYHEDHDNCIPEPTPIEKVNAPENCVVSLVLADTDQWRRTYDNKAVKKTLSIPSWLNIKATKAGVNFSQVLQDALIAKLM